MSGVRRWVLSRVAYRRALAAAMSRAHDGGYRLSAGAYAIMRAEARAAAGLPPR